MRSVPQLYQVPATILAESLAPVHTSLWQNKDGSKPSWFLKTLVDDMENAMLEYGGVGLAANQVGHYTRVFVYKLAHHATAIFDPELLSAEGEEIDEEGCLSIPGVLIPVKRATRVTFKGKDINGAPIEITESGAEARVLQHELDHLDGVLITDYVKTPA